MVKLIALRRIAIRFTDNNDEIKFLMTLKNSSGYYERNDKLILWQTKLKTEGFF